MHVFQLGIDMTTTIRVSKQTRDVLRDAARERGISVTELLDQTAEKLRREAFFKAYNEAYAALEADPKALQEWKDEMEEWDTTLMDGLKDED